MNDNERKTTKICTELRKAECLTRNYLLDVLIGTCLFVLLPFVQPNKVIWCRQLHNTFALDGIREEFLPILIDLVERSMCSSSWDSLSNINDSLHSTNSCDPRYTCRTSLVWETRSVAADSLRNRCWPLLMHPPFASLERTTERSHPSVDLERRRLKKRTWWTCDEDLSSWSQISPPVPISILCWWRLYWLKRCSMSFTW